MIFFIQQFNVRSLSKNKEKIEEFFDGITRLPDAIAISETKLNSNRVSNLNVPNYTFLREDSPTCAGEVGFYIKQNMQYCIRNDLFINVQHCEDLWIELKTKKENIILAVIYRHPNKLLLPFHDKLCDTLTDLENSNLNYIVCGDINVNFFAKDNEKITDYMNNLAMIGCKMKIKDHTRFGENCRPTLLDHIYTNIGNTRTNSGVAVFELSGQLPTFFMVKNTTCCVKNNFKFIRCMKHFVLEHFLTDLNAKMSEIKLNYSETNVNTDVSNITLAFKSELDIHAPLRPQTRKEKTLSKKSWITTGLLKSIKTKNKLFRKLFKSNNSEEKMFYKKYLNKLTHVKYAAKRNYNENLIKTNSKNSSQTWSAIREIIDCKHSSNKFKLPSTITIENQFYKTDSKPFLDKLCDYFATIGASLSENIAPRNNSSFK